MAHIHIHYTSHHPCRGICCFILYHISYNTIPYCIICHIVSYHISLHIMSHITNRNASYRIVSCIKLYHIISYILSNCTISHCVYIYIVYHIISVCWYCTIIVSVSHAKGFCVKSKMVSVPVVFLPPTHHPVLVWHILMEDVPLVSLKVVDKLCKGLGLTNDHNIFTLFEQCGTIEKNVEDRTVLADVLSKFER